MMFSFLLAILLLRAVCEGQEEQRPDPCDETECGDILLEKLFFNVNPSIFTDGRQSLRAMYRMACDQYDRFLKCREAVRPRCLRNPLERTCIKVHETICKAANGLFSDDKCITAVSFGAEYQAALKRARDAVNGVPKSELFCAIPEPYLTFEAERLTLFSNARCDKAMVLLQPYVRAILDFTNAVCGACGQTCQPLALCANTDCVQSSEEQALRANFRPYPPKAEDYEHSCIEFQTYTECRRKTHPTCLNNEFDLTCLASQASLCAAASSLTAMRYPKAFSGLSNLPRSKRGEIQGKYDDCADLAKRAFTRSGFSEMQQFCRLPGIYQRHERCRAAVYKEAHLYEELSILETEFGYAATLAACRRLGCSGPCGQLEDVFCPMDD